MTELKLGDFITWTVRNGKQQARVDEAVREYFQSKRNGNGDIEMAAFKTLAYYSQGTLDEKLEKEKS